MKSFFKILAVILAIGATAQTLTMAKDQDTKGADKEKGRTHDGPGV